GEGKPEKEMRARRKTQLFEGLSECCQRDFAAAEKLLPEFEKLAREAMEPREERKRRLIHFLFIAGKGREQQGRRIEAVKLYVELAGVGGTNEMLTPPDDPNLKVSPTVWV